jgi:hypothetical protein
MDDGVVIRDCLNCLFVENIEPRAARKIVG